MIWARLLILAAPFAAAQSLDFEIYKSRVEPIFFKKRPGHARCVACHVDANTAFRLQPLTEGPKTWTEELKAVLQLEKPPSQSPAELLPRGVIIYNDTYGRSLLPRLGDLCRVCLTRYRPITCFVVPDVVRLDAPGD